MWLCRKFFSTVIVVFDYIFSLFSMKLFPMIKTTDCFIVFAFAFVLQERSDA